MMNMQKIKKLTTQSELKLIQAARARKIEDSKKLKSLVKRTRILRNKYQDLAKYQNDVIQMAMLPTKQLAKI